MVTYLKEKVNVVHVITILLWEYMYNWMHIYFLPYFLLTFFLYVAFSLYSLLFLNILSFLYLSIYDTPKPGSQKLQGRPGEILGQLFWRGQHLGRTFEMK